MRSRSTLLRRGLRHPDVFVASLRHHSTRLLTRPIRTTFVIVFTYVFVVVFATFANNPEEVRTVVEESGPVSAFVPLLPPTTFLLVLAGAALIGVPIGLVVRGVRRDLSSSRRRRQRRDA